MAVLLHGTTLARARQILEFGPDLQFVEPEGTGKAENFSTYLEHGPFLFQRPEEYALGKAKGFPDELGPAIVAVDVPDDIIALAAAPWLPIGEGIVQFDKGAGIEELLAVWPSLHKEIRTVEYP